jgi:hypothetical protein
MRRRWLDFRQGHTIYLVFAMTFLNFITIQYKLLVVDVKESVPALQFIFTDLWIFATIFIAIYMRLAIVIGYWHRKTQWKVEQEAMFSENIVQARLWLFMMNLVEGKATEAERKKMREMLEKIIRKLPPDSRDKSDTEAA